MIVDRLRCHYFVSWASVSPSLTLAVAVVAKGKTSKEYLEIKKMAFTEPDLLHAMLKSLADSIGDYANYQVNYQLSIGNLPMFALMFSLSRAMILGCDYFFGKVETVVACLLPYVPCPTCTSLAKVESGAQVIQVFDSWAGHLSPRDYDVFAAPYQVRAGVICVCVRAFGHPCVALDEPERHLPEALIFAFFVSPSLLYTLFLYAHNLYMLYYTCPFCTERLMNRKKLSPDVAWQ